MTPCKEHPRYTGQRKPRTDCKTCLKLYKEVNGEEEPKPSIKKSEEAPRVAQAEAVVEVESRHKPVPGLPERGTYVTLNDFRHDLAKAFEQLLPQYRVRLNSYGNVVQLEERQNEKTLWYGAYSRDSVDASGQKTRAELLKELKSKDVTIRHGDVLFVDGLQTVVIVISFNLKSQKIFFKEWHSNTVASLTIKEFEDLKPRNLILQEDLTESKHTIKIMSV